MKTKRTISSYILLAGVMGLSIVGGVVAYQIYSSSVKSTISEKQSGAIKPIDGAIKPELLIGLENREVLAGAIVPEKEEAAPTSSAAAVVN